MIDLGQNRVELTKQASTYTCSHTLANTTHIHINSSTLDIHIQIHAHQVHRQAHPYTCTRWQTHTVIHTFKQRQLHTTDKSRSCILFNSFLTRWVAHTASPDSSVEENQTVQPGDDVKCVSGQSRVVAGPHLTNQMPLAGHLLCCHFLWHLQVGYLAVGFWGVSRERTA